MRSKSGGSRQNLVEKQNSNHKNIGVLMFLPVLSLLLSCLENCVLRVLWFFSFFFFPMKMDVSLIGWSKT